MKVTAAPFRGQHCETTATGTLLKHVGIDLSEPMLFGLGEGLSFIFWKMKTMDFPFIGGRVKPDLLTQNIARNLGLKLVARETSSRAKAWSEVKQLLDDNIAVGLKLDCYFLEYFSNPIHFAGHYVAMVGYDSANAFLVDTVQQGTEVSTSLESLAQARSAKGPMSSRNMFYTIEHVEPLRPLNEAIVDALRANAQAYLAPPINNLCFKGILKTSNEIVKWFDESANAREEFATTAMLMERAGTGGALFRNLYRDFLGEAFELTGDSSAGNAHNAFVDIASLWSEVIALFEEVSNTGERTCILQAADILVQIADREKEAMEMLL